MNKIMLLYYVDIERTKVVVGGNSSWQ